MDFNQSYKNLETVSKLVNSTPGATYRIPTSTYKLKKSVNSTVLIQNHICCSICQCFTPTTSNNVLCDACSTSLKTSTSKYFVYIPFADQLKKSVIKHFEKILSYKSSFDEHSNLITDVQSAFQFKKCQANHSESLVLSLTVSTDGAKMYNSSNDSLWPIQVVQNFLPPKMRYISENIIVVGLHRGKPKMKDFFFPFLNELEKIVNEGGMRIDKNGRIFTVLPVITSLSADLPAKAEVQGMVGHSGYFGCGYCLQKGDAIKKNNKSKAVVRFISKDSSIRTHEKIINTYDKLRTKPIHGIKSVSCMVAAHGFDLVNGFCIDYMHCVLLGIMRKLLDLWLNTENASQPFFITKKKQIELNRRILRIKPTSEITRKPRSLDHRKELKANEFRSLLLYYLRYCLADLLQIRYINHFQLLSSAIYILLKEQISNDDISIAEARLREFADQFEMLYGNHNVTMNLHLIRHIANSVRHLGPLWSQSTFSFETNNGFLVKSNHAKTDFLQSVAWKYVMKCSLQGERNKSTKIAVGAKKNARIESTDTEELKKMGLNTNILTVHPFVSLENIKFTSLQSKEVSTVDYFVKFKSEEIGAVKYYIVENQITFVLAEMYSVVGSDDHLLEIHPTHTNKLFKIEDIACKLLFLKIAKTEIVTSIPNRYEKT